MVLRSMEGFDDGLHAGRHNLANGAVDAAYGKNGRGMRVGDTYSAALRKNMLDYGGATGDTFTVGLNGNIQVVGGGWLFGASHLLDTPSSYYNAGVRFDSANSRLFVTDRSGSTYAAINTTFVSTWYYWEFQWNTAQSPDGAWELRQDGVTLISASSRDTRYLIGTPTTEWFEICGWSTNWVDSLYVDNFYATDTTGSSNTGFLGICEVQTLLPSGNGTTNTMTGSDENQVDNYLLVDNNASVPPVTTEYVESATEGHKDTYAMGDLTGTPTVYGVAAAAYAQKDASGAKYLRNVVRSGTTDYVGTSLPLSDGTYGLVEETWDQDPDTSTAWTASGVNAMEAGQEVRDS